MAASCRVGEATDGINKKNCETPSAFHGLTLAVIGKPEDKPIWLRQAQPAKTFVRETSNNQQVVSRLVQVLRAQRCVKAFSVDNNKRST
jgi:hypothetical protein